MDQGFPTTNGQNLVDLDFLGIASQSVCQKIHGLNKTQYRSILGYPWQLITILSKLVYFTYLITGRKRPT